MNGPHKLLVPFTECLPVFQPFVYQDKALVADPTMIELGNEKLSYNKIKSLSGIKIEDVDRLVEDIHGVLDDLSN